MKKKRKGVTSEQPSRICSKLDSRIHSGLKSPDVKVGAKYSKAESISNNHTAYSDFWNIISCLLTCINCCFCLILVKLIKVHGFVDNIEKKMCRK